MVNIQAVVIGSAGMLGFDLLNELERRNIPSAGLTRETCDVTNLQMCIDVLRDLHPEIVFNCAGFTRVDDAEHLQEQAMLINAEGAGNVARGAAAIGARCVYLSSDYVFDGEKGGPYFENDAPAPLNAYGRSKLQGEQLTAAFCPESLIVRTSWLYGSHGRNFVLTMLEHAAHNRGVDVVADQIGCPTATRDLSRLLAQLVDFKVFGILHAAGAGYCTWHQFATAIFNKAGAPPDTVRAVGTAEYPFAARRPRNSTLESRRLGKEFLIPLPAWIESLNEFVAQYLNAPQRETAQPN